MIANWIEICGKRILRWLGENDDIFVQNEDLPDLNPFSVYDEQKKLQNASICLLFTSHKYFNFHF
jgi:hypothetical protein